jgi:ubiquinone/menaquinone biosynthesis C-methylase UbiE
MHRFSPEKADILENEDRYSILKPDAMLREFGLGEGMQFLDIGAGTGFFSRAASKIVGETGKIYSVDISIDMLNAFRRFGVPRNVQILQSDANEIPLHSAFIDMTLLAFILHESEDVHRSLVEAARITKPNGRIVIVEWKRQSEEHGPPIEDRISLNDLLSQSYGFYVIASGDLNPSHYYCILQVNHDTREVL